MKVYAIRGATTCPENNEASILNATAELLKRIIEYNNLVESDIISIIFSTTQDLDAAFPAKAAREMGLVNTALMCTNEMNVPGSLARCIRILLHFQKDELNNPPQYVYLKEARFLRPDLI